MKFKWKSVESSQQDLPNCQYTTWGLEKKKKNPICRMQRKQQMLGSEPKFTLYFVSLLVSCSSIVSKQNVHIWTQDSVCQAAWAISLLTVSMIKQEEEIRHNTTHKTENKQQASNYYLVPRCHKESRSSAAQWMCSSLYNHRRYGASNVSTAHDLLILRLRMRYLHLLHLEMASCCHNL